MSTFAPCETAPSTCFKRSTRADSDGQRTQRRLLVQRIARLERRKRRLELLQEFVGEFLDDDESLRGAAGLPGIVHPSPDRPFDGVFEIGVFEDDERVAAAELHRGWLEVLAGACRDASAGRDAAGQRHALDARVIDDVVRLIVRDQQIGIQTGGRARLDQKLLEGDRALRHDARVLHQQRRCPPSDADRRPGQAGSRENSRARRRRSRRSGCSPCGLRRDVGWSFTGARKRSAFLA